jgi:alpha-1,6-mannosyl-glycoprotein beta-1,2-N-acetylglucosaminyltransferase
MDNGTWYAEIFRSGPMTMSRVVFEKVRQHAKEFCHFDDYNWDWSVVHLQGLGLLPHTMLFPSRSQVRHIGTTEGMHIEKDEEDGGDRDYVPERRKKDLETLDTHFKGTKFYGHVHINREERKGYGGWGHPKDQAHCMKMLES